MITSVELVLLALPDWALPPDVFPLTTALPELAFWELLFVTFTLLVLFIVLSHFCEFIIVLSEPGPVLLIVALCAATIPPEKRGIIAAAPATMLLNLFI